MQFLARGSGYTLFLTPKVAILSLHSSRNGAARANTPDFQSPGALRASTGPRTGFSASVSLQLIGANTSAQATGVDPLPGKSNYFVGRDPAKWHTDVATYAKVRYSKVYPGIDLLYYGNQEGELEHDFVLAPGADPSAITIGLRDCEQAVTDQAGALSIRTGTGALILRSPLAYQVVGGMQKTIPAAYILASNNRIKFQLGSYDRSATLVIDPVIQYTGVFGGSGLESGVSIAVDSAGNAYVAGGTDSTDFPLVHPIQVSGPESNGGYPTSFVTKINAAGTALLYSTYLGGAYTGTNGIAVDKAGNAYLVGQAFGGLPLKNARMPLPSGGQNAFVTVFGPAGNTLIYSTYLGGSSESSGNAIALDGAGNAYVTGRTLGGFPKLHSIPGNDGAGIFVAKFDKVGSLQYSSVLALKPSATRFSSSYAIAVDASGAAYVSGTYLSPDPLPITKNAFRSSCVLDPNGDGCVFAAKFSSTGDSLEYATILGPGQAGNAIAVDSSGSAYIAGMARAGFPVTKNAFQRTFGGNVDGFVTKLNSAGSGLVWSTYLGGSDYDFITGLALDQHRTVYVTGVTNSKNFPLKADLGTYAGTGGAQGFVTTLSGSLDSIVYYSTYTNTGYAVDAIAVDKALNVYLTGADGEHVPTTPGALNKRSLNGDVFVSKLVIMDDLALGISASPNSSVAHGSNLVYTLAVTSKGPDFGNNVRLDDPLPAGTTFLSLARNGGTCTTPAMGATGTVHCVIPQLNKGDTFIATLTVKVTASIGSTLSNSANARSDMQDFVPANNKAMFTSKVN